MTHTVVGGKDEGDEEDGRAVEVGGEGEAKAVEQDRREDKRRRVKRDFEEEEEKDEDGGGEFCMGLFRQ